jgi:hypothetical protein
MIVATWRGFGGNRKIPPPELVTAACVVAFS